MAASDSAPAFNPTDSFVSLFFYAHFYPIHHLCDWKLDADMVPMQSKRMTAESLFGAHKAEPSVPQPPLDMERAESSRQHVRALNTQFARFMSFLLSILLFLFSDIFFLWLCLLFWLLVYCMFYVIRSNLRVGLNYGHCVYLIV